MTSLQFRIPLYNFDVKLIQMEKADTEKDLAKELGWGKVKQSDIKEIWNALNRGAKNGGDTWRNFEMRKIAVVFYPFSNEEEKAEVFAHEKRHIEDRVMEWASVDDIESAGLIAGFLGRMFYRFKKKIDLKK